MYTQLLDERGGIVGDVTVTRLGDDRFRVVTGAGAVDCDRGWLALNGEPCRGRHRRARRDRDLGARARAALAAVTDDDVSAEAFRSARPQVSVGGAQVLAQRITYVGELGFELYVAREWAVQVWDAIVAAASPEPVGYHALDSLRMEKGYRYFGADLTSPDTPFEAGLGFCVATGEVPRARPRAARQRLRTLVVGDDYVTVYGGEAVHAGGEVIGRVRSAATASPSTRTSRSRSFRPAWQKEPRSRSTSSASSCRRSVAADVLYDPENLRVRS